MISVEEALDIVNKNAPRPRPSQEVISPALGGAVLAETILAPIDLPMFAQSSMDGYALCMHTKTHYRIVGEIQAGSDASYTLQAGEAVRIFTGAPVPSSADAVVIQEKVQRDGDTLTVASVIKPGQNIRTVGSQVPKGSVVLKQGTVLNAAALGLLQSLGLAQVQVYKKPRVAILVTGDELISIDEPLAQGKIYESNSLVLKTALHQMGITEITVLWAKDTQEDTERALAEGLKHDVLLISGGISVGDYDFVGSSLATLGVKTRFYKVRQKPGKPLFFGTKEDTHIFALPGNPASTLSCFYVYVLPILYTYLGKTPAHLPIQELPLNQAVENKFDRALFLKAQATDTTVSMIDEMNSATLISFAHANALVYIPETIQKAEKNTSVKTWILPEL